MKWVSSCIYLAVGGLSLFGLGFCTCLWMEVQEDVVAAKQYSHTLRSFRSPFPGHVRRVAVSHVRENREDNLVFHYHKDGTISILIGPDIQ